VNAAGLILAAGESKRMGSPKALLEFRGETFLDRLTGLFARYCSPVIVVLGCEPDRVRAGLKHSGRALFVVNRDYRLGQFSSMQAGLRAVPETAGGVLFTLVDHPNPAPSTIEALLAGPAPLLAIPTYNTRRGHPIFFRREMIPEFLALPPASSAKDVIARHLDDARWVDTSDPGVRDDVDDPAAYRRLLESA
jgi:molybdenum cofactor cytidylyltransferase